MERTIFLLLLCTAVEGDIGEHIFVHQKLKWQDAQDYCRANYIDLSSVSNQREQDKLLSAEGADDPEGWIGLHRDNNNRTLWKWSGGGHITYENWNDGQPDDNNNNEPFGHIISNGKWNDGEEKKTLHFFCISISVVEVRKSWEEALEHCRDHNTLLTSLRTEIQHIHAMEMFKKVQMTEPVWIGMRYLEDHWLWVNGDPLSYVAWPPGTDQDYHCPIRKRCGALTKEGLWENRDCLEKLYFICY